MQKDRAGRPGPSKSLTRAKACPIIAETRSVLARPSRMSEPLRTEPAEPGPLSDAERAARIEQLLLSGLDHYFGGNYEQAIHVWTRVAFLERGHGRARAYIERARGALAERHREAEECLERGLEAYQARDFETARRLLTRVVEQGGANETALLFLQRLGHLDSIAEISRGSDKPARPVASSPEGGERSFAPSRWIATTAAGLVIVGVILVGALGAASWLRESPAGTRAGEGLAPDPLPTIRDSEILVARAARLRGEGRGLEALKELEQVQLGDPLRSDADRLKADIQRALLRSPAQPVPEVEQPR